MKSNILYRAIWLCNLIVYVLLGAMVFAQDEPVTTRPISVQGQASLPNYTPPGALMVLVGGVDGTLYGSAESELDGSFIVEAEVPEGIVRVLVHAVDPTNPEAFASASIALNPSAILGANPLEGVRPQNAQTGTDVLTDVRVNAQSMAELMVLSSSGDLDRSVDSLPSEDQAAATRIAQMLDSTTMRMCSVGPSAEVTDVLQGVMKRRPLQNTFQKEFDGFVFQPGSLLERLRAGQKKITMFVGSANQPSSDPLTAITEVVGTVGVRTALWATSPVLTRTGFYGNGEVALQELGRIANFHLLGRAGNCRGKGLMGAYLATRFPEFKQVAAVAVESEKFYDAHVVGIACTEDKSVYNINDYIAFGKVDIPPKMLKAGCYVIDPWDDKTELFTQEYVKAQQWKKINDSLLVAWPKEQDSSYYWAEKWKEVNLSQLVVERTISTPQQRMMQTSYVSEAEVPVCTGSGSLSEICAPFNDPIEVSHFNRFRIDFNIDNPVEINGVVVDPDGRPTSLLDWGHTGSFEEDTYRLQWSTVGVGNVKLTFDIYARLNARHTVIYDLAYEQSEDDLDSNSVYFLERKFVATDIPLVPLAAQPSDRLKFMLKEPEQQVCERIFEYSDFQRKNVNYERREDLGSCDGSRQLSIEFYGSR